MRSPQATFMTRPAAALGATQASRFAETTFSIKVKSLDVLPSPWMVGASSRRHAATNFGITAEYLLFGSCRGPKMLKYLRATVSRPKLSVNTRQYSSPVYFWTA